MFYDKNYVRQLKLAKLEGKKYVEKTDITGVCLFEQDWKYKLFRCDYNLIWCYLRDNYSFNHDEFDSFIEEHTKMSILTPTLRSPNPRAILEHKKMNILNTI